MLLSNFRPSGSGFARVEHQWSSAAFAEAMVGPSMTAVGWIPAYQDPAQLPNGFLQNHWLQDLAIPLLLGSGNQAPPKEFDDETDFLRHLNTLDYRGVVSIDKPTLYLDVDRQPTFLHFDALARVGSTAVRANPLLWYSSGVGMTCGDISDEPSRVTIRVFMRLKLSPIGQTVAKLQTGHWPPWATVTIEYTFDLRDQIARMTFLGTRVPSWRRYVDWSMESEYRMEYDLSAAAYEGFIEAGGCQDALAHSYSMWAPLKWLEVSDEG